MPHEVERGVDRGVVFGADEHGVVELVQLHTQEDRLPLVAHAVQHAHGILVALAIGLGNLIGRVVGHAQQVLDLAREGCRVHRDGEGIDRVAHVLMAHPLQRVAHALQVLHQAGVVAVLPCHDGRQCGTGEHGILEIMSQRIAAQGIQVLARVEDGAGAAVHRRRAVEFHLVGIFLVLHRCRGRIQPRNR